MNALLVRSRTDEGTAIQVSLFEALGEWNGLRRLLHRLRRLFAAAHRRGHAAIAPYGPFSGGDGEQVYLAVQNEREWARFCQLVLERPTLAADPRFESNSKRVENRETLEAVIEEVFRKSTVDEIRSRLERAEIATAL